MSILDIFRQKPAAASASAAKERLQIIVARERTGAAGYDFMPELQREIIALVGRYVKVSAEDIKVSVDNENGVDVIDVSVHFPQPSA